MSNPFDTTKAARGSSLQSIKTAQKAREEDDKLRARRRRGVIVMLMQFLQENGYKRSLDALEVEAQTSLSKVAPADNMDVMTIFAQFEEFYELKFGKRPRFYRNVDGGGEGIESHADASGEGMMVRKTASPTPNPGRATSGQPKPAPPPPSSGGPTAASAVRAAAVTPPDGPKAPPGAAPGLRSKNMTEAQPLPPISGGVSGTGIKRHGAAAAAKASDDDEDLLAFQGRAHKPLPNFDNKELNELAGIVQRDILDENPTVSFAQIAELDAAKKLLKEAVVMPVKYPQLFQGIVRPWKGILLFGPPGTGKTMLAKAVATECRTTFFNISASTLVSKWRGDSEKLVRMLFDLAVHYAPSTIFIDELDAVMSARGADSSEHEASRRMKTEFMVQMDGLAKRKNGDIVFVLAASNLPWDLDSAILRRLEKRIYVPLPSAVARQQLLRQGLPNVEQGFDHAAVAAQLVNYSGADIDILCREATMRTVRTLIDRLEADRELSHTSVPPPRVTMDDVAESVRVTRPASTTVPLVKYADWAKNFGSTFSGANVDESARPSGDGR